ncbi:hypothetical protein Vadar_011871 [Vaccinium darrowii]|uniref:Uncharacterized protein n=1 Tax=Vaccinium darrowii TaxID=229202 RepID=A0ACB7XGX2_9ERIC|nr:hypothetical protein Vadar_011871 [Vaccinium darrowii]
MVYLQDELEEKESSDAHRQRLKSNDPTTKSQRVNRKSGKEWGVRNRGSVYHTLNKSKDVGSFGAKGGGKLKVERSTRNRFRRLSEEIDLDEKSFALLDYLSTFGLIDSHFIQMQPQILEYPVENKLKSHVAFLASLSIPDSIIGQLITATPCLFSYVRLSLFYGGHIYFHFLSVKQKEEFSLTSTIKFIHALVQFRCLMTWFRFENQLKSQAPHAFVEFVMASREFMENVNWRTVCSDVTSD